jgi:hypothetical protein
MNDLVGKPIHLDGLAALIARYLATR